MTRNKIVYGVANIILLFGTNSIVSAETPAPQTTETALPAVTTESARSANAKNQKTDARHSLPTKIAGAAAGIIVGVPASVIRKPIDEEKYGINSMVGKTKKGRTTIPTGMLYSPFALISGTLEAPFFALNRTIVNFNKPFSKAELSLTESKVSEKSLEQDIPTEGR
jgi:hypothetical protein